jgi:hypothetical protein
MATISITATGLTARAKTISGPDTARLLNACRKVYGQIITQAYAPAVPPVLDGQGNVITPGVSEKPEIRRDMTDQEIFNKFADESLFAAFISLVRNAELPAAVATAVANTTASFQDIAFT